jgi:hypothetical protein
MFDWIRKSVKSAFLAGVKDGIEELQGLKFTVEEPTLTLEYNPYPTEAESPPVRKIRKS